MKLFSGIFFLGLMAASFAVTAVFVPPALSKMERPTAVQAIHGEWSIKFEKSLGEALPIYNSSRNFWGKAEYALFREGRKGAVVGADGWLFTDEEFSCPVDMAGHIDDNLSYIKSVRDQLAQRQIKLAVVLVPAKVRVYPDHLGPKAVPACRSNVYGDTLHYLQSQDIPVADLLPIMISAPNREALYLKTDTHWTPDGARLAALAAKETVGGMGDLGLTKKTFASKENGDESHSGDLMRYIPGVDEPDVTPDHIQKFATAAQGGTASDADLFGNAAPPVTLVGTSYSANQLWNFEGFLKEALQADLQNMADEGQGPFTVMDHYLKSQAYKDNAPKLVLWEIPERYIPVPARLKDGKAIH